MSVIISLESIRQSISIVCIKSKGKPRFGVVHVIDAVLLPTLSSRSLNIHSIEVYPNPVLNSMKLQMQNSDTQIDKVEITHINGNVFWTGSSGSLDRDIDLSRLSSGAYFVKIISKEGIGVKKFIKM